MSLRKLELFSTILCWAALLLFGTEFYCRTDGMPLVISGMSLRLLAVTELLAFSILNLFFLYYPKGSSGRIGRGVFQLFGFGFWPFLLICVFFPGAFDEVCRLFWGQGRSEGGFPC